MANESKKFALFCCCMMTMQALRLVISTAGFCVVRFHIDCELFNIFISRLVNAVMMSQLFGNWLGDLIVFAADGHLKLYALAAANWAEFFCFCSALICLMHTECGHLTGFYWSMVMAYFWWKVGEAPCTSIGGFEVDYYFAGFTLSGVWAACLKGLVMRCVAGGSNTVHFKSDPLGDVNVKVVGARSVKTTVDYRGSKALFVVVIVLTFLMSTAWTAIAICVEEWSRTEVKNALSSAAQTAIQKAGKSGDVGGLQVSNADGGKKGKVKFGSATLTPVGALSGQADGVQTITIAVNSVGTKTDEAKEQAWMASGVDVTAQNVVEDGTHGAANKKIIAGAVKGALGNVDGAWDVTKVEVASGSANTITFTVTVCATGVIKAGTKNDVVAAFVGIAFGGVLAVPGAMLGAWMGWTICECCLFGDASTYEMKWFQLIFGIVGALGGMAAGAAPVIAIETALEDPKKEKWVPGKNKWEVGKMVGVEKDVQLSAFIGLGVGTGAGVFVGLTVGTILGCVKGQFKKRTVSGLCAGALVGGFVGLFSGEIYNANKGAWEKRGPEQWAVAVCGMLIVVIGLGTVYSIYPGMAPCSITQFKYFNIIDITILILSSIGPIVIMYADLKETDWKLAGSILFVVGKAGWAWLSFGIIFVTATIICEILVLSIMQHPFSKLAHDVSTSPGLACLVTIMMVTCQLVSSGIGFGCVAAGSFFNDGFVNVNSTLVLWTVECCGVLGEGYLTEIKKYEPGKWPTQGMGKWDTYWWWNRKAFGNAWKIWCCIGTTDLRRDIMLCKK